MLGAAMSVRQSVKTLLDEMLLKNVQSKVKIVHEAIPQLYIEHMHVQQDGFSVAEIGRAAGKEIISKLIEKLVEKLTTLAYDALVNYFKARADEFKNAQAQPQDGVTVKLIWTNIAGMASIRAVINAIRGNLTVGSLSDLALPSLSTPEIKIEADKKFD